MIVGPVPNLITCIYSVYVIPHVAAINHVLNNAISYRDCVCS